MNNIQNQIDKLQTELDTLKELAKKKEPMFPRANDGETYFYADSNMKIRDTIEGSWVCDRMRYEIGSYFLDEEQAEKVAKHIRESFWFTRKAIEFADGYKHKHGVDNYYATYGTKSGWVYNINSRVNNPAVVYMSRQQANKFIDWLNIHKPKGV